MPSANQCRHCLSDSTAPSPSSYRSIFAHPQRYPQPPQPKQRAAEAEWNNGVSRGRTLNACAGGGNQLTGSRSARKGAPYVCCVRLTAARVGAHRLSRRHRRRRHRSRGLGNNSLLTTLRHLVGCRESRAAEGEAWVEAGSSGAEQGWTDVQRPLGIFEVKGRPGLTREVQDCRLTQLRR